MARPTVMIRLTLSRKLSRIPGELGSFSADLLGDMALALPFDLKLEVRLTRPGKAGGISLTDEAVVDFELELLENL